MNLSLKQHAQTARKKKMNKTGLGLRGPYCENLCVFEAHLLNLFSVDEGKDAQITNARTILFTWKTKYRKNYQQTMTEKFIANTKDYN